MSEQPPSAESDAPRAGRPRKIERPIDPIVTALHRERVRLGLSQTALAQRMGLETYGTISEHERGVNLPNLHLLRRWSLALGLDVVLEPFAKAAQERYDAEHDPFDFHCLTDPCAYHLGETRIRPLPTFPASMTHVLPTGDHDHEKCCRYLHCAHPKCCGYYGDTRVLPPGGGRETGDRR